MGNFLLFTAYTVLIKLFCKRFGKYLIKEFTLHVVTINSLLFYLKIHYFTIKQYEHKVI